MQSLRRPHRQRREWAANGQFTRMSALDRIADEFGTPWHGALLEDFELGLHVLLTGARTEYCDETFVAQTGLPRVRPLLRQRSRWAQGSMQCLQYLWRIVCSPQVSLPGALEIAYYLWVPWSQLLGSIVFPAAMAVQVWYMTHTGDGVGSWWAGGAWGLVPLAALFGVLPHVVVGPVYRAAPVARSAGAGRSRSPAQRGLRLPAAVAVWWRSPASCGAGRDWKKTTHAGGRARCRPPDLPPPAGQRPGTIRRSTPHRRRRRPGPSRRRAPAPRPAPSVGSVLLADPPTAAPRAAPTGAAAAAHAAPPAPRRPPRRRPRARPGGRPVHRADPSRPHPPPGRPAAAGPPQRPPTRRGAVVTTPLSAARSGGCRRRRARRGRPPAPPSPTPRSPRPPRRASPWAAAARVLGHRGRHNDGQTATTSTATPSRR